MNTGYWILDTGYWLLETPMLDHASPGLMPQHGPTEPAQGDGGTVRKVAWLGPSDTLCVIDP